MASKFIKSLLITAAVVVLAPAFAFAHTGVGDTSGFVHGLGHPISGLGIALSVAVLGAIVALGVRAPVAAAMGVVGLFAIFHGHAHGAEMPEDVGGVAYVVGFMIATALLHLAGISAGVLIGRAGEHYGSLVVRSGGGLATVAGFGLLTGIL